MTTFKVSAVSLILTLLISGGGCGHSRPSVNIQQLLKDAAQGNTAAQCDLGYAYATGNGVEQNVSEAITWYRKAADLGDAKAQHNLGFFYASGRGVGKNITEAVNWFRKSASQGNASAQYSLGVANANGYGVVTNMRAAYVWFLLAEAGGNSNATSMLISLDESLPPSERQAARDLIKQWKPTPAQSKVQR